MGIPVEPITTGVQCNNWIDPPNTPGKIYSVFWGIQKGSIGVALQPPNLRVFSLYQRLFSPCVFEHIKTPPAFCSQFGIQANACWLYLFTEEFPRRYYFSHLLQEAPIDEYQLFTNFYQVPINTYGYGGFGTVFWMDKVIDLAEEFGWDGVAGMMHEIIPIDAVEVILKFCSTRQSINVQLRVDI